MKDSILNDPKLGVLGDNPTAIYKNNDKISYSEEVKFYGDLFAKLATVVLTDAIVKTSFTRYVADVNNPYLWLGTKLTAVAFANAYSEKISYYAITPIANTISDSVKILFGDLSTSSIVPLENKFYSGLWGIENKIIANDKDIANQILGSYSGEYSLAYKFTIQLISNLYAAPITNNIIAPTGRFVCKARDYIIDNIYKSTLPITLQIIDGINYLYTEDKLDVIGNFIEIEA